MSGTPLVRKLGFKAGQRIFVSGIPESYFEWIHPIPAEIKFEDEISGTFEVAHIFGTDWETVEDQILALQPHLPRNGSIWISWPKKSANIPCDISGQDIRQWLKTTEWVDVKVCSINDIWTALKIMIRKELR
ncbi:hypothetical protein [Pontibacter sp. G13]|uniref:hypothetical protein n=1 Tax=Pontibacter sp. G13 TaxID=3074898 RepID=UPI00288C21AF|nr:hypothetical protein [Pontibacter sp. G13]WNJ18670.1 hypothetical protein RJD25_27760 [Pontibacter sp. G13]